MRDCTSPMSVGTFHACIAFREAVAVVRLAGDVPQQLVHGRVERFTFNSYSPLGSRLASYSLKHQRSMFSLARFLRKHAAEALLTDPPSLRA
jgi:hypothetical protein